MCIHLESIFFYIHIPFGWLKLMVLHDSTFRFVCIRNFKIMNELQCGRGFVFLLFSLIFFVRIYCRCHHDYDYIVFENVVIYKTGAFNLSRAEQSKYLISKLIPNSNGFVNRMLCCLLS